MEEKSTAGGSAVMELMMDEVYLASAESMIHVPFWHFVDAVNLCI